MESISITAKAGFDILQRIASGEWEVHGILVRDAASKQFRHILIGLQDLPASSHGHPDLPAIESLRSVLGPTRLLQAVEIAQNAAMAFSMRRIEASLANICSRLNGIDERLKRIDTRQTLTLAAMNSQPHSRLAAATAAAAVALPAGDKTALILAGKDADQATRDLVAQAMHMVNVELDQIPVSLVAPLEFADIVEASSSAAGIGSAIWLALDAREPARQLMAHTTDKLEIARKRIAAVLCSPDLLMSRIKAPMGTDADIAAAGQRLRNALHQAQAREVMIALGAVTKDTDRLSIGPEKMVRAALDIAFLPLEGLEQRPHLLR